MNLKKCLSNRGRQFLLLVLEINQHYNQYSNEVSWVGE